MNTRKHQPAGRDTGVAPSDKTGDNPGGKVAHAHNKTGQQRPTQRGEGQRTPQSRNDRASQLGSGNQTQSRKG